ncbi:MAG: hypothetical protein IPI03_09655 [Rubrivivax sp.]|nr:hypothetical protein [Rubrivivax sp.]
MRLQIQGVSARYLAARAAAAAALRVVNRRAKAGERAHQQGVTLLATLNQVDLALQQTQRVIGLLDGAPAFNPPEARVSALSVAARHRMSR